MKYPSIKAINKGLSKYDVTVVKGEEWYHFQGEGESIKG